MVFPAVQRVGGLQPDVSAYANALAAAGVLGPDGQPITEALTFGVAGGIGFLYGVFVYGDEPTMTIVGRNTSTPNTLLTPVAERLGIVATTTTTGGAKTAKKQLDAAIAAELPAVCLVGSGGLPFVGLPPIWSAMAPAIVGVVGADEGSVFVDDRRSTAFSVERSAFDRARAGYKQGKHLMITVAPGQVVDWERVVGAVLRAGVAGYDTPPVPQFASNIGQAGLAKFARLLTTPKDPKSWAKVFPSGQKAAIGLSRLVDCLTYDYASAANSRSLYAQFLDEVAPLVPAAAEAAVLVREAAARWLAIVERARAGDPAVEAAARCSDERDAQLRSPERDDDRMIQLYTDKQAHIAGCALSADTAQSTYNELGVLVSQIAELERDALAVIG